MSVNKSFIRGLMLFPLALLASPAPPIDELFERALAVEKQQEALRAEYSFHERFEKSVLGRVTSSRESLDYEVTNLRDGQPAKLVLRNGLPVTNAEDTPPIDSGNQGLRDQLWQPGPFGAPTAFQKVWFDLGCLRARRSVSERTVNGRKKWVLELQRRLDGTAPDCSTAEGFHETVSIDEMDFAVTHRAISVDTPRIHVRLQMNYQKADANPVWLLRSAEIDSSLRTAVGQVKIHEMHTFSAYRRFGADSIVRFVNP